jgi:hypothetical protein
MAGGSFKVAPHRFEQDKVNLLLRVPGGAKRLAAETDHGSMYVYPTDALAYLYAPTTGLTPEQGKALRDGCRPKILAIVKKQLELIAEHKGDPEELRVQLGEQSSKVWEEFDAAASAMAKRWKLEFRTIYEGDKRWTIRFVPEPAQGCKVFVINAGDYDVYLWRQKKGLAGDGPGWVPVGDSGRFGDDCRYYVFARWEDGKVSEVEPFTVIKDGAVRIHPQKKK